MTTTTELLAETRWTGPYGFRGETRLVRRGGKTYLIHDHYCGEDRVEGGCLRPHVYEVPTGRVAEVRGILDDHELLEYTLAELYCIGRQDSPRLRWAREL